MKATSLDRLTKLQEYYEDFEAIDGYYPETKEEVFNILESEGIPKNSSDWNDYTASKLVCTYRRNIPSADYKKIIEWINLYLKVKA